MDQIKIGTRGSKLALIQTRLVSDALNRRNSQLKIEPVVIKTEGDKNMAPIPLDTVGKAWFTAEIDRALKTGTIDMAVHSLKDLPLTLDPDFAMITVLKREDPRDVLISKTGETLEQLPAAATIGTDSTRRRALLLHQRPDLNVDSLRGNVQTRLRKLAEGDCDAIILAAAGLRRLDEANKVTQFLDSATFIPSVGQGALAVVTRMEHADLLGLLRHIEDSDTVITTNAERAFATAIGGSCKMPVGCHATLKASQIHLYAIVADATGLKIHFDRINGPEAEATSLARALGERMMASCGFALH